MEEQPQSTALFSALSLLKIFAGTMLALSAFLGSLVPELLMRSSKPGEFQSVILPVGNALSAGLLFGAGMLHFFSEGTSALATISLTTSLNNMAQPHHSSNSQANAQQHHVSHQSLIHAATHSGFATAAPAMMLGYLLSLILDRVVLEKLKRGKQLPEWLQHGGGHGHSHGSSPEDEALQHPPHSIATENANGTPTATPLSATSSANAASVLTIAVLMSLHSAIEGTTLALETSAKTLRGAFIPLFIHRFFDGVVVGFQASAMSSASSSSSSRPSSGSASPSASLSLDGAQLSSPNNSSIEGKQDGAGVTHSHNPLASFRNFTREMQRIVFRKETILLLSWSVITPVVLILVLLFTAGDATRVTSGGGSNSTAMASALASSSMSPQSWAGAWAQCFAAGSFVYISGELLNEVFSKSATSAATANANNASTAGGFVTEFLMKQLGVMGSRVFGLLLGVAVVLLLEAMDE